MITAQATERTTAREHELAERAGVDPEFIRRLADLGIVRADDPERTSPGDVRRAVIVASLDRAGVAPEAIGRAVTQRLLSLDFIDAALYDRFASISGITFEQLSSSTGIPAELLMVVREAMGAAQPSRDDRVRDDELQIVPLIELQVANGVRPVVIERWLRVLGDSMRRVAETEADWWHTELLPRLAEAEVDPMSAANELAATLADLGDRALVALYHSHQAHAWTKSILEAVEGTLESAGLHRRTVRLPAICFLDLTGYTRLTEEHGDAAGADVAADLMRIVSQITVLHGGRPIKWLGDGAMMYFPDPRSATIAALEMVEASADAQLPAARAGVDAGPVLFQDGDYFGQTVNRAARIAERARPGEVLVTHGVVAETDGEVRLDELGATRLKGIADAVRVWSATRVRRSGPADGLSPRPVP